MIIQKDKHKQILASIVVLLIRKNADYGSENIAFTGLHGVVVRMCDKAFRLHNLVSVENRTPNFESIVDSLKDLIAYCVIGHLLVDKLWNTGYLAESADEVINQIVPTGAIDVSFIQAVNLVYYAVRDLYDWSEYNRNLTDIKVRFRVIAGMCLAALLLHEDTLVSED